MTYGEWKKLNESYKKGRWNQEDTQPSSVEPVNEDVSDTTENQEPKESNNPSVEDQTSTETPTEIQEGDSN